MSMHSRTMAPDQAYSKATLMAVIAVVLAGFMIVIKGYLFYATGASSFLASLLDSFMDICLSTTSWFAVKWASKPADHNHRYGHGKIEALGGLFQVLIVGSAAVTLGWHAGEKMANPGDIQPTLIDIGLSCLILVTTTSLVVMQSKVIDETGSVAISGDRAHYTTDILSNAGLLIMLLVNMVTSVPWLDPVLTLLMATVLLMTVYEVGKRSVNTLLDHEVDEETRQSLLRAALRTGGVEGVHDFRAIESGMRLVITMDIEVDRNLSVIEAHDIAREVEASILFLSPNAEVVIHVDPKGDIHDSRHLDLEPHHFS